MTRRVLGRLVAVGLAVAPLTGYACDPNHDWETTLAVVDRTPAPGLLRDTILRALREVRAPAEQVAVLAIEDRYAMASGSQPLEVEPIPLGAAAAAARATELRAALHRELEGSDYRPLPLPAIDAVLAAHGPDAAYDPTVFAELEAAFGPTLFVRLVLLRYQQDDLHERDRSPLNPGIHRESRQRRAEVRLAVQDATGTYLVIDELHPLDNEIAMFEVGPDGRRENLETVSQPWLGPYVQWHKGDGEVREGEHLQDLLRQMNQTRSSP